MGTLEQYRASESEMARTSDLLRLLPKGRNSVLDIGARDGHFSRLLTNYFHEVTALDLQRPDFDIPGIRTVAGDVTSLDFETGSFDCVFCAEVLEHVPDVQRACQEILRVAKHEIVIGVPFKQDIRVDRCSCRACGKTTPQWGHVNSFDEARLQRLFAGARLQSRSFVGTDASATNPVSAFLMDLAGNPWGSYDQDEPCVHCGAHLSRPSRMAFWQRLCCATAVRLVKGQSFFVRPHGNWIHLVFSKSS
jgi:SAM-dependent methyltransferase